MVIRSWTCKFKISYITEPICNLIFFLIKWFMGDIFKIIFISNIFFNYISIS